MWPYLHVISIGLFLILSWLLCYKIARGVSPTLKSFYGWFRASWKNKLLASFVLLFIAFFLVVNIFSSDFVAYNENETKYTYSFYMTHMLWPSLQEYGTNQGGLFPIFAILYHLLGISTFPDSILLSKALLTLAFFVSFYLVWNIISFFIKEKRGGYAITTLLSVLYFSMPQISSFFWQQAIYHLFAHLLFLISLAFILDYSKSRSAISLSISHLSVAMAYLTRPEFGAFALLIFSINLAQHFDFSRLRFKELGKKEKILLLLSFIYIAAILLFSINFIRTYGVLYPKGDNFSFFLYNLQDTLKAITSPLGIPLFVILALVSLLSLIFSKDKRELLLICILFYLSLNIYLMRTIRYETVMYVFYLQIIMFMLLAHAASWLLGKRVHFRGRGMALGIFLLVLIFSSCYLVMTPNRPSLINDWIVGFSFYDRQSALDRAQEAHSLYLMQKGKNAVLFEKYSGNLYYKFVFAGTNNTLLGFESLKELNTTYSSGSIDKLIFLESPARRCTLQDLQDFFTYFSEEIGLPADLVKEDYPLIMSNLEDSTILPYAKYGDILLCRIIYNGKR